MEENEKVEETTKKTTKTTKKTNETKMNIYQRMLKIQTEMETVSKGLNIKINDKASYKAVSERDVIDAVKKLEEKYGVYSYPIERGITESDVIENIKTYNGNETKTNNYFMRLETTYRFVNVDDKEDYIEVISYGDGIDTGDKAPGKAMTYADKYALMKAYKISTGDDPDQEASPEQGYQKTTKTILASEKQIKMLTDMYKENEATIKEFLTSINKSKFNELTIKEASDLITKIKEGK